jgi:hypothetical protein
MQILKLFIKSPYMWAWFDLKSPFPTQLGYDNLGSVSTLTKPINFFKNKLIFLFY